MLSKNDILNELGKGICVYPLDLNNIKENSLNLCAGEFAWATTTKEIYYNDTEEDKNLRFSLFYNSKHTKKLTIEKGRSAVVTASSQKYIIMLPCSTTLIETKEVLSIGNYIGGTYHSKVGLVSKGIGHIGTMVGPNFSGDSLIAFHNVSNDLIVLNVGESFISVIFYYLNTPNTSLNPTTSGHQDKFAELGLCISESQATVLNQDWKKQFAEVRKKMCYTDEYKNLQDELKQKRKAAFLSFINKRNIITWSIAILIFIILYIAAIWIDFLNNTTTWVDRFFNVGFSGIFIAFMNLIFKISKNNSI